MRPFVKIALRSFERHRLRNFLTVLAVSAAVALVIGVNIAFESASLQYQQTMHVASGYIDIVVRPAAEDGTLNTLFIDTVRKVEGVSAAFGRVSVEATVTAWSGTHTVSRKVYIIGVSDEDFAYNDPSFTDITGTRQLGSLGIVLDSRVNGKIGYSAVINSNYHYIFNVVGISTPRIFGEISIEKNYYCFINLTMAQKFFGMEDEVDYIIVKVSDPAKVSEVAERIRQQLPFLVVFKVRRNVAISATQYAANFQRMLQFLSYLPIAIAFVICFNSSYMNILERKREIGIMQSLGARRRQVFWMLLSESLLKIVGLFERADHKPDELSGGEQQRVAIARAMANEPIIILADEPTGDLDIETGKEVMSVLRDLAKREEVSVIVVTHNPVVAKLADRVLQIRNGKII